MLAALLLTLRTDKSTYAVGEAPTYTLQNAQPGSVVKWTSFKDGQPTGEYEEDYGGTIGSVGGAELVGGNWNDTQIGRWQKIAVVYAPDGSKSTATVFFTVQGASANQPVVTPTQTSWLGGDFNFTLGQSAVSINRGVALIGGSILAYVLINSTGKRR